MFPTMDYAAICRFCETYVSEYVLWCLKVDVKSLVLEIMSDINDDLFAARPAKGPRRVEILLLS
jgi:hypothetical protein